MKPDMDEKNIKDALNEIQTPQYDIFSEVRKQMQSSKSPMIFKKKKLLPLLLCLSLLFSLAMASDIPAFNRLLAFVRSDIALILQPIVKSCEDQGIKMEVIAAMNDDEMAVIYITMQDLVGNRIDETLDIYDYRLSGGTMFNCQIVHYDKITKTATLRIQMNGGKKIRWKKYKFSDRFFP